MGSLWSFCTRRTQPVSKKDNNANRRVVTSSYHAINTSETAPQPNGRDIITTSRESSPQLNDDEVALLLQTWGCLKDEVSKVGVVMFMRLFETHPDVQQSFQPLKDIPKDEMLLSKELRTHALRVMGTVEKVLSRVNDPVKYEHLLHELGRRHVTYNVRPNYILFMAPQFINALRSAMESKWTPDIEKAWYSLFVVINFHIISGMTP